MARELDVVMAKQLARLSEVRRSDFVQRMDMINRIARQGGLMEYTTYCRIWEYPWLWSQFESMKDHPLTVLDVGSERSPFPWVLATEGFNVIVSDRSTIYWDRWHSAAKRLHVSTQMRILDAQALDLPTASVDIYLSVSVIEHIPDKSHALAEAARVLRPGGLLIMTFDICEPDLGMTFPEWNGRALSMRDFDDLFRNTAWFEEGLSSIPWNENDIADYLAWHRTTAPHHNYVTGAAVLHRNTRVWEEVRSKTLVRSIRSPIRRVRYSFQCNLRMLVKHTMLNLLGRSMTERVLKALRRLL